MFDRRAALGDGDGVFVGQRLALALLRGAAAEAGSHAHLENDGGVGAEAADDAGDCAVESREDRTDGDDGTGSDDHAEHGQERADLVFSRSVASASPMTEIRSLIYEVSDPQGDNRVELRGASAPG